MSRIGKVFEYISHVREKSRVINKSGLYTAFTFISVYALIMSIVCFLKSDVVMGVVNAVIALFMILTILVFSKIRSPKILSISVVVFLYALMMFFMYEGGVGGVSIMWLLFVPTAGMAMINLYYGSILSILIGISVPLYMLTPLHNLGYQYSENYRIRFPIIYWAFLIMAFFIFIRIDKSEEAQKELIRKADESNRSKSEFLANMSHELRTPMNAIMGMCEITLQEEISDTVRENNQNIYSSSKNLMNIINDLLDFSKIGSGKMELSCNRYSLSKVIDDVINMITVRKGSKNLEFIVDCDPDIPDMLYGDELRIRQIMINLLTNALKYTHEGSFILSVAGRRDTHGINLIFTVKDSGIGIKKEHIDKIFDAYGRVDAEKTHKIEGTGLGLPITKKLVRLMNGALGVKSVYGRGTEFKVVIPQGVVDEAPLAFFEKRESDGILYYFNLKKMPRFAAQSICNIFGTIGVKLGVDADSCESFEELEKNIAKKSYTHIFTGRNEYLENKVYFDRLSETCKVIVVQDKNGQIQTGEKIVDAYKPFYIKRLYLLVSSHSEATKKKAITGKFTAPQANILIVDDNAMNLKVAMGYMKPYDMKLSGAKSGKQALKMMTQKKYDIVFMDHLMPEMDGIEAHREICLMEENDEHKTPVIALTANEADEVKDLFDSEKFQGFLSKPIQADILREILLKWLPENLIVSEKEHKDE